jgi:hypothetical protein
MNPFSRCVDIPEFSLCSLSSGSLVINSSTSRGPRPQTRQLNRSVAESKNRPKKPIAVASGAVADDASRVAAAAAAAVPDAQAAIEGGAAASAAVAGTKGKNRPKKPIAVASGAVADDASRVAAAAAAAVPDAQAAIEGGAAASAAVAGTKGSGKQSTPDSSFSLAVANFAIATL